MNKTERDELRRLIRARFKVLKADVAAREAELHQELREETERVFAARRKMYDDAMYAARQAVDEANRKVNDIYREVYGREVWGERSDKQCVTLREVPDPDTNRKAKAYRDGSDAIAVKVKHALLELDRREVELLAELATTALDSAEAKQFMVRIPTVSELVPAARLIAAIEGE